MKRLIIILSLFPLITFAQPYGNEWLDFSQDYYKIMVPENAIYKITYADLQAVGFPVDGVNPKQLQMFRRGEEIAIHIEGQADNSFDAADYILFYGQRNDGQLDQELYVAPEAQPHQYLALYADSAAYFLTHSQLSPGKRMDTVSFFNAPAPDQWVEQSLVRVLQDQYAPGITDGENTQLTQFDYGEGFTGLTTTSNTTTRDIDLSGIALPNLSGPNPELELTVVGRNSQLHDFEVLVGPDAGNLVSLGSYSISGYNHLTITSPINWDRISPGGNLKVRIAVIANGGTLGRISISAAKLQYARLPDANNSQHLEVTTVVKPFGGNTIVVANTTPESMAFDITDPFNSRILEDGDTDPNSISLGFSDATLAREIAISEYSDLFSIRKARLRPLNPANHNYLIISHDSLMQTAGNYTNTDVVTAYAEYRASETGGSYDTLVVNIEMLYNQFSYGQPTPVAIFRFMRFMAAGGDPKHLFIIGKGLDVSLKFHKDPNWQKSRRDFVPTGGNPGSDLVYTVGLAGNPYTYSIPVGRLGALTPLEVANYLDKVKEMESLDYDALWRKNLLHLSGGNDLKEIKEFSEYVKGYAKQASGPYLGGKINTFSKQTTNSVELINVAAEVNEGVNIITFFGHSSPNTVDIDIGFVTDPIMGYDNPGKYPLILMNGCSTGNIYENNNLFSEDWMHAADKGAIGAIAHSSYGDPTLLNLWTRYFYQFAYEDSTYIKKSIGEVMVATAENVMSQSGTTPIFVKFFSTQVQQMGLQGDPAVKLFGTARPDYEISGENIELVSFNGGGVTAQEDSFALALAVPNYGAFILDSLEIAIRRTLPDFSILNDTITFAPVAYQDTLYITQSNLNVDAAGINVFDIRIDPLDKIQELDESNNYTSVEFLILNAGTENIKPGNYSLQANSTVDLMLRSADPLMNNRQYSVELDTAADFSSLYRQPFPPLDGRGVLSIKDLALLNTDTATYYWRSRYTLPGENESDEWQRSSFSVIQGTTPGWAQLEYPQHAENILAGLAPDEEQKQLSFRNSNVSVYVKSSGIKVDTLNKNLPGRQLTINGVNYLRFEGTFQPSTYCFNNRLNIVAIDKETSLPYAPIFGIQTDPWTCGLAPEIINSYSGGKSLDEIIDAIDDDDKVILFTVGRFDFNTLSATTIDKLENLGADASVLVSKDPDGPYLMVGTKGAGAGNSFTELVADPGAGPADMQTISYSGELTGTFSHGKISTTQVGPAAAWQTLYLDVKTPDPDDYFALDVTGYNMLGEPTLLFDNVTEPITDLSAVDAAQFPFLKLDLDITDTATLTAPQLQHWIVNFDPVADGLLVFDSLNEEVSGQIVLNEGEDSVRLRLRFINISNKPFENESLEVIYSSFNRLTRNTVLKDTISISAPLPGESSRIEINFDPKGMIGENDFNINVNPMTEIEQSFANNRINMPNYLEVIRDDSNPLLDVSFDGEYIFDGDIVNPNPNISIIIRDENPYLLKVDTAGVTILLKRPCENCTFERIPLSGTDIVWTPEDESNPFAIDFTPKNLENGIYELQVQVEDASGNLSGTEPYKISFEVINESTVTNFYPYPNPFSTSVKFIFTLTGSELPDELMIRIMTVSGRVVREIMQEELGPLKIGNNVSDYAWDGRDEFGDQLANGVYLYKVFMRKSGQNVELRPSAGDRGFTNGYGKLYLLR